ncbi:lysM and putative peptidoglycan-binding domain-containing protein 4 [Discoglossus pictus]
MRLKEKPSHSFQPPSTIHSSLGSRVYTFSNGAADTNSSSEEEFDVMELRPRGGELQRQNASREKIGDVILLERIITQEDNLNKLALQYGCTVADIKRVNNLIREQDIYALKTIKIPVKVHGLLTEGHSELNLQHRTSLTSDGSMMESLDIEAIGSLPNNTDLSLYFHGIDRDIEAAAQTQELLSEPFDSDSLNLLTSSSQGQRPTILGADWGIRWWNAVFIMLLIGIVLPVFYILYYMTHQDDNSFSDLSKNSNFTTGNPNRTMTIGSTNLMTRSLLGTHRLLDTGD